MKTLPRKALERNTKIPTRTKMKSIGMPSAILQSNASNLRKIVQVAWTLRTSLSILRKIEPAGDGVIKDDSIDPVPVGNSERPGSQVTGDVEEDRITKFTDEGEERNMAGDSKHTVEKSDL